MQAWTTPTLCTRIAHGSGENPRRCTAGHGPAELLLERREELVDRGVVALVGGALRRLLLVVSGRPAGLRHVLRAGLRRGPVVMMLARRRRAATVCRRDRRHRRRLVLRREGLLGLRLLDGRLGGGLRGTRLR